MRPRATFRAADFHERLTWIFAGQVFFALGIGLLGLWLH
jgi:hypothetical protein